jgi:hypothetical protein
VVADANVVLSALIARAARDRRTARPRCIAAEAVALEITRHIPRLANNAASTRRCFRRAASHAHRIEASGRLRRPPRRGRETDRRARPRRLADRRASAPARVAHLVQEHDLTSAGRDVVTTGDLRDAGHIE